MELLRETLYHEHQRPGTGKRFREAVTNAFDLIRRVADIVKTSVLKPAITTIEQSLATVTMGQLRPEDAQALRDMFAEIIASGP